MRTNGPARLLSPIEEAKASRRLTKCQYLRFGAIYVEITDELNIQKTTKKYTYHEFQTTGR